MDSPGVQNREVEESILRGNLDNLPPLTSKVVRVFISSTFSDTVKERNALIKDVYPRLKEFCRSLGLEFQAVDMRWGVREEAQDDHMTSSLCMREIIKCRQRSAGPTFVAFIGQKYGYRPFPANIRADEFHAIVGAIEADGKDVSLLDTWFKQDDNESPTMYRLQPISSILQNYINTENEKLRDEDRKRWWDVFAELQKLLRDGARMAYQLGILENKQAEKYFTSVTEEEIYHGLLSDSNKNRQLVIKRTISDLTSNLHHKRAGKFIDLLPDGTIDREASALLQEMNDVKIANAVGEQFLSYTVDWSGDEGIDEGAHHKYLSSFCKDFYDNMINLIVKFRSSMVSAPDDPNSLMAEIIQHANMCKARCEVFLGRGEILKGIQSYLEDRKMDLKNPRQPLVVHGESGSGKTSILAMAVMMCSQIDPPKPTIIFRFLGTSPQSTNIYNVLSSICSQIAQAYDLEKESLPDDFNKLVTHFKSIIKVATEERPLVIILDSLDQLTSSYNALTLSWFPWTLPPHVHLVTSVMSRKQSIMKRLKANVTSAGNFQEIPALGEELGYDIVRLWLKVSGRKLTQQQNEIVQEVFNCCSLPLYTKLVFEEVQKWPSYLPQEKMVLPPTVQGIINMMLQKLEVQHGKYFVSKALSYITASRNGLSEAELEDILSLDDEVLDEVFTFWVPPIRRLPPLLWTRLHEDLSNYLVSRGANGATVLAWYHRQFIEVGQNRYLNDKNFKTKIHSMLADYFLGKWHGREKPFTYNKFLTQRLGLKSSKGQADRKVSAQPVSWPGPNGTTKFNCRKLSELPFHLYYSNRLDEMWRFTVFNYDWINARIQAGSLPEMLSDISLARYAQKDSKFGLLFSALKMAGSSLMHLPRTVAPELIARLNSYTRCSPDIDQLIKQCESKGVDECALLPLFQCFATPVEALVSCLEGHTKRVRDMVFSRDSNQLYSVSEDGLVCIWDVQTGERLHAVDISHLPVHRHSELHVTRNGLVCELYTEGSPLLIINPSDGLLRLSIGKRKSGFIHNTIACKKLAIREGEVVNIKDGRVTKSLDVLTRRKDFVVVTLTHNEKYVLIGEKDATRMFEIESEQACLEIPNEQVPSQIVVTKDDTMAVIGFAVTCIVRVINIDLDSDKFGIGLFRFDYKKAYPDYPFEEGGHYCQEVSEMGMSHDCEKVVINVKYHHAFVLSLQERDVTMIEPPDGVYNIANVCFSSDDEHVIGMVDSLLCVWDADTGDLKSTKEMSGSVGVVATASANNILASVSSTDHVINVWNIEKLEESAKSPTIVYDNPLDTLLVSPQHNLAFIKTYRRLDSCKGYHYVDYFGLDVWELGSFSRQTFLPFGHHGSLSHTSVSLDGEVMILCTNNLDTSHVYALDTVSGHLSCHLTVPQIKAVQISPSNSYIMVECIANSADQTQVQIYNATYGTMVQTMSGCHSAIFTLDSQYALAVKDQQIIMFSLIDRTKSKFQVNMSISKLQVIPNHHDLVLATEKRRKDTKVQVFSLFSKTKVASLRSVSESGLLDISRNGQIAVDGQLQVFDLDDFVLKTKCPSQSHTELSLVRLTYSGCHVLWADTKPVHCINAFQVESQQITATVSTHSPVLSLELVDAGFKVLAGCADGHLLAFGLHSKSSSNGSQAQDTAKDEEDGQQIQGESEGKLLAPRKWSMMRLTSVKALDIDPLYKHSKEASGESVKLPKATKQLSKAMKENAKQVRSISLNGEDKTSAVTVSDSYNAPPQETNDVSNEVKKDSKMCTIL